MDRDINTAREEQLVVDTDVEVQQDFHPEDTAPFEDIEHTNPARLTVITIELDDLYQRIQAEEGQPTESLHCIEQELQQLSTSLNLPIHTEPLGEVLKHYITLSLCSAQNRQTSQIPYYRIYLSSLDMIPHC